MRHPVTFHRSPGYSPSCVSFSLRTSQASVLAAYALAFRLTELGAGVSVEAIPFYGRARIYILSRGPSTAELVRIVRRCIRTARRLTNKRRTPVRRAA